MEAGLITRAKQITGATNAQIARLLGLGESTVQAYDCGRLDERLTTDQAAKLIDACKAYRDDVVKGVAELELLS